MQTHLLRCPTNWPLLENLKTYLWKEFPMDGFSFTANPDLNEPVYKTTHVNLNPERLKRDEEPYRSEFLSDIHEAVRNFLKNQSQADR